MKTCVPDIKTLTRFRQKPPADIALPIVLASILMLAIWFSTVSVEARYQLHEQIGFVVKIPASTN